MIDSLIVAAATGSRVVNPEELERVLQHVAAAGFDPHASEQVRGRLAGAVWKGVVLTGRDRLPPAEVHYLWHVVAQREWPAGTTLADYEQSIREVILDPSSGVFVSRYQGAWQIGMVRRTAGLRGPNGFPWVLIEYRLATGHWVTAYQPVLGLRVLRHPGREGLKWLRRPRPVSGLTSA